MTDYPKFVEMQKMFHGKSSIKGSTCCRDTNNHCICKCGGCYVTTISKVTKEHVFKDKELIKAKNVVEWEKEKRLKQSMVETIQ